jgi:hypothetical protein
MMTSIDVDWASRDCHRDTVADTRRKFWCATTHLALGATPGAAARFCFRTAVEKTSLSTPGTDSVAMN